MNKEQFCWWIWGFFEISGAKSLNERQLQEIKNHLELINKTASITTIVDQLAKIDHGLNGAVNVPFFTTGPVRTYC